MSKQIFKSTAQVVFVMGEHLQDFQVLIDDEELYNSLPGKFERHGIKTLASWPIFITAILNEQAEAKSTYALDHHQAEMSVHDGPTTNWQLPIFDQTSTANPT